MSTFVYMETPHLLIRQYTLNDVSELFEIMSNPKVHQYTKDKIILGTDSKQSVIFDFLLIKISQL